MLTAEERVEVIRAYGMPYRWFVETGTADGTTTIALARDFDRLITIELDHAYYLHVATERLMHYPNILPLQGDSATVLKEVVYWLPEPAIYWLDAHYSGGARADKDTPIVDELFAIGHRNASTILIDDARLFGTDPAYPTLEWVERWAHDLGYTYELYDDIIRLT